jgi:hypothetical protein
MSSSLFQIHSIAVWIVVPVSDCTGVSRMCGDSDRNADAIGQVMFSHCYDGTGHRQRYCTKAALRRSSQECLRNRQRAGRRPDSRTILGPESLRSVAAGPSGSEIPDPSRFRPELVRMRPSDGAANRFAYNFIGMPSRQFSSGSISFSSLHPFLRSPIPFCYQVCHVEAFHGRPAG